MYIVTVNRDVGKVIHSKVEYNTVMSLCEVSKEDAVIYKLGGNVLAVYSKEELEKELTLLMSVVVSEYDLFLSNWYYHYCAGMANVRRV